MNITKLIAIVFLTAWLSACGGGDGVDTTGRLNAVSESGTVKSIAGTGSPGFLDGNPSKLAGPTAVAVGPDGTVYVADTDNNRIRKIVGTQVSTLAGNGNSVPFADGPGDTATFSEPKGVAVDALGNVYVTDSGNKRVRKITPLGVVTTLATFAGSSSDPRGIALDSTDGTLYVSDFGAHVIYRVTSSGAVSVLAGSAGVEGDANGASTAARFRYPWGLALSTSGQLYVADRGNIFPLNHLIRKVDIASGVMVSTFAGVSGQAGHQDGPAATATFTMPAGVAVDSSETVYVADTGSNLIRKIDPLGVVTTVPTPGMPTSGPHGIAVDIQGNLYLADTFSHSILKIKK